MRIGLVGYARTGKDTVCQMIQEYLFLNGHGKTKQLAFGDELKDRFFKAFPEAFGGKKPREWYEDFGELGRGIDVNMWIKPVEHKIDFFSDIYENFVITDIRQKNEANWAKDNDFILINVWSPAKLRQERSKDDSEWQPVNRSERFLHEIDFDYEIMNGTDFEDLKKQVEYTMEEIINGN